MTKPKTNIDLSRGHLDWPTKVDRGRLTSTAYGQLRPRNTSLQGHGEYHAFKKALTMKPEAVVGEIKAAGLVGGAGPLSRPALSGKARLPRRVPQSTSSATR